MLRLVRERLSQGEEAASELAAHNARLEVDVATFQSQISSFTSQLTALQLANSQLVAEKEEVGLSLSANFLWKNDVLEYPSWDIQPSSFGTAKFALIRKLKTGFEDFKSELLHSTCCCSYNSSAVNSMSLNYWDSVVIHLILVGLFSCSDLTVGNINEEHAGRNPYWTLLIIKIQWKSSEAVL